MRVVSIVIGTLIVMSSISTMSIKEAASKNGVTRPPERRETKARNPQAPPPISFEPYVTPWKGRFDMSEEQSIIVGELVVDCYPNAPAPQFEVVEPSPAFVRIAPIPCTCPDQARAKVIVFPRRGDAGKYHVALFARSCTGLGDYFRFILKVKATQE